MVIWDHFIGKIIDRIEYALRVNKLCLWPGPLFNRICIIIMPQTLFIYELKTIVTIVLCMHTKTKKNKG